MKVQKFLGHIAYMQLCEYNVFFSLSFLCLLYLSILQAARRIEDNRSIL